MTPTVHEYVRAFLTSMRAQPKERIVSTVAGTTRVRSRGERILYAPDGVTKIRVIEEPDGGTHIEHGDHLHAVARPKVHRLTLK